MDTPEDEAGHLQLLLPSNNAVGQLSFSPATQTTVVTTTTTTTTTFPPFILNAPKELISRDPEVYPLAAIPTPAWLKKLSFSVGDRSAQFEEADDAENRLREVKQCLSDVMWDHKTNTRVS